MSRSRRVGPEAHWLRRELRRELRRLEAEHAGLLAEGRSAAEVQEQLADVQEQLRELYERGTAVPHRVGGWQRVAVVVLRVMAVFCLVCVVLGLAWGFWLNAVLSGVGAVAFWVWASDVRDRRVES